MKSPGLFLCAALTWLASACQEQERPSYLSESAEGIEIPSEPAQELEVPPPPFSEGVFPCTDCHDPAIPPNTKKREMKLAHTEVKLHHDEQHRWCLDCHSAENRDKLHLASGELIDFTESYKLCGQCHGDKYRDWRAGVHGRRSGNWDGHKKYLLCVNCHNSHSPKFQPLKPLPPPIRPAPRTSS